MSILSYLISKYNQILVEIPRDVFKQDKKRNTEVYLKDFKNLNLNIEFENFSK